MPSDLIFSLREVDIKFGKKSIRYYSKDGKTYLENIKESLSKGFELS